MAIWVLTPGGIIVPEASTETDRGGLMRQVDVDFVVAAARFVADQLLAEAADPHADLSQAERRGIVTIAVAIDREVTLGRARTSVSRNAGRDQSAARGVAT